MLAVASALEIGRQISAIVFSAQPSVPAAIHADRSSVNISTHQANSARRRILHLQTQRPQQMVQT
jgi:hypothetical protein